MLKRIIKRVWEADGRVRGNLRTLAPGRRQVNIITSRKREHSRKPDELYDIVEQCSPGPYLELFARHHREGWSQWGNEIDEPARQVERDTPEADEEAARVGQLILLEQQRKYRAARKAQSDDESGESDESNAASLVIPD